MSTTYFSDRTWAFLRGLRRHNTRDWFEVHRDDYETHVRGPALQLIEDMAEPLAGISPQFRADARKVGGSLFRIQRDTRFSKDKTPYKTHIGIRFRHQQARDVHTPLFYLHVAEGESFVGGGLWRPDGPAVRAIRSFIVANPAGWKQVTRAAAFRRRFELGGDSLKRPPRGFDPEHPLIEDLKRKDFVASANLPDADLTDAALVRRMTRDYRRVAPMIEYLCEAIELPF